MPCRILLPLCQILRLLAVAGSPAIAYGGGSTTTFRVLSADSVFNCIFGDSSEGTVSLRNCSNPHTHVGQTWSIDLNDLKQDKDMQLPLVMNPSLCLGAREGGKLGVFSCKGAGPKVTQWQWQDGSESSYDGLIFMLRHVSLGLCLERVVNPSSPYTPLLELTNCPEMSRKAIMSEAAKNPDPTKLKMAPWRENQTLQIFETVMEGRLESLSLRRFMWIPVAVPQLVPQSELPLRSVGKNVVGGSGRAIRLRGVNWYGFHMQQKVNNGLDNLTPDEFARIILNFGFNHVRLGYASQMLVDNPEVEDFLVAASPALKGLRSAEIFDKVIEALTNEGLLIIINNHVSSFGWCCDIDDRNSLWYGYGWTEEQWYDSLRNVSKRYRHNPRVIGYDLRNEVRPDLGGRWWYLPWWGRLWGQTHFSVNWQQAAQEGSKAVWQGNPDALVFAEGVFAVDLSQIPQYMMEFGQDCLHSRVVYSVHDYTWFSLWYRVIMTIDSGNWLTIKDRIWWWWKLVSNSEEADTEEFRYERDYNYGALKKLDFAPVWIGEFGTFPRTLWWARELEYLRVRELDFAYWSLHGNRFAKGFGDEVDKDDWEGLTTTNFTKLRSPWKLADMARLLAESGVQNTPPVKLSSCVFDPALALNIPQPTGTDQWVLPFQFFMLGWLIILSLPWCLCCCFCCQYCQCCVACKKKCRRRRQDTTYYGDLRDSSSSSMISSSQDDDVDDVEKPRVGKKDAKNDDPSDDGSTNDTDSVGKTCPVSVYTTKLFANDEAGGRENQRLLERIQR